MQVLISWNIEIIIDNILICCYLPFCNPKPFLLCNFCFPLVHIFCNFYIVFSELFYIFDGILFDICLCIRKSKNILSLRNLYMMSRNKRNDISLIEELMIIQFFFKTYLIWSWLAFISITWFTIFIRVLRFTHLEFQYKYWIHILRIYIKFVQLN